MFNLVGVKLYLNGEVFAIIHKDADGTQWAREAVATLESMTARAIAGYENCPVCGHENIE